MASDTMSSSDTDPAVVAAWSCFFSDFADVVSTAFVVTYFNYPSGNGWISIRNCDDGDHDGDPWRRSVRAGSGTDKVITICRDGVMMQGTDDASILKALRDSKTVAAGLPVTLTRGRDATAMGPDEAIRHMLSFVVVNE